MSREALRALPSVERVLETLDARRMLEGLSRQVAAEIVRDVVEAHRASLLAGAVDTVDPDSLLRQIERKINLAMRPSIRRVLNASGVLLHTNLGRAPLADDALRAIEESAGSVNLELNLGIGRRASRQDHVVSLLVRLTGAQGALVVNNNAAAVFLVLTALAAAREVVVSRGEQVEIGGSFRMPDVMRASGARLVEVGTTNRVHLADYEAGLGPDTALLVKVHRSNFRLVGFVSDVPVADLAALGRRAGVPVFYDLGSGALVDLRSRGLPHEPTVQEAVTSGADLVTFSGDKLLGGPQAGVVVGRRDLVDRVRSHPLYRAIRIDKLDLAALEATLRLYLDPDRAWGRVPVLRMLAAGTDELRSRSERVAAAIRKALPSWDVRVMPTEAEVGGGSLPGAVLPSFAVALRHPEVDADSWAARLRTGQPAVLPRIQDGAVLLDLRSLLPEHDDELVAAVATADSLS
jgi:L-seryl-tRNA(Ser) seleniumtransferase